MLHKSIHPCSYKLRVYTSSSLHASSVYTSRLRTGFFGFKAAVQVVVAIMSNYSYDTNTVRNKHGSNSFLNYLRSQLYYYFIVRVNITYVLQYCFKYTAIEAGYLLFSYYRSSILIPISYIETITKDTINPWHYSEQASNS